MVSILQLILKICLVVVVQAWSCNVHKLIVNMVRPYLSAKEETYLLSILNRSTIVQKKLGELETIADPVCLPDSIKREKRYRSTASWHYLDIDFDPESNAPISEEYFSLAIDSLYIAILDQYSIFVDSSIMEEKGDALLYLLHLLGDAMQPFHVIQLRTSEFPDGDKGGLLYSLYKSSFRNLHLLTDNVANYFSKSDFQSTDIVPQMNSYCEVNGFHEKMAPKDLEERVEDWLIESHNRGIQIYQILNGEHQVSTEMKEEIQLVLLQGICRATTILLEMIHQLLYY